MIRWCSYCQRFLGERPPYDDLSITHGMCPKCESEGFMTERGPSARIEDIARFFRDFLERSIAGAPLEPADLSQAGERLGIGRGDLLLGIVQPTLYELGRLFMAGRVTAHREAELSGQVERLLDDFERWTEPVDPGCPGVALGLAETNRHHLGPRIFAHLLAEEGLKVDLLDEYDTETLMRGIERGDYACVGVSVALPAQLRSGAALARAIKERHPHVLTLLGGPITKDPARLGASTPFDHIVNPMNSREDAKAIHRALRSLRRRDEQRLKYR